MKRNGGTERNGDSPRRNGERGRKEEGTNWERRREKEGDGGRKGMEVIKE